MSTASANEEAPAVLPPRELVVDAKPAPGDASDGGGTAMAPFAIPVAVGGALAKFVSPLAGLGGLAATIALLLVMRKPREGRFVLRVEDGILEVTREKRSEPVAKLALVELLDVTLDNQQRAATGRGGSASTRTRIALERLAPDEPIYVPDERVTPLEAQEWVGKVRVFLRKHGWLPKDER